MPGQDDRDQLHQGCETQQRFFRLSPDALCIIDPKGYIQLSNGRLENMLGYSPTELAAGSLTELLHPDDVERTLRAVDDLLRKSSVLRLESRCRHRDGSYRWLSLSCTYDPLHAAIYCAMRDSTYQRLQEEQYKNNAEQVLKHAQMLELLQDAIIVCDINQRVIYWSAGAERLYGYRADEAVGREAQLLLKNRFQQPIKAAFGELMKHGAWQGIVTRCRADGIPVMADCRWTLKRNAAGVAEQVVELSTDITEHNRLDKKRSHLAAIVEQSTDAMLSITTQGIILSWNRGAERMFGYAAQDALGRRVHTLATPQSNRWVDDMLLSVRRGHRVVDADTLVRHKTGKLLNTSSTISPIRDSSGRVQVIAVVIKDITAQRTLEKQMARLERYNVVGQLAAGIGHEIRNPMTTVRGFVQLFALKPEMEPYRTNLELMLKELDEANNIVTQFLSLARNRPITYEKKQLNEVIRALLPILRAEAIMQYKQVREDLEEIPELLLNEKEISQLILNLANNGLESMSPSKTLTISTRKSQSNVLLIVKDQGAGIPQDIVERIWLPFYTTKESRTGLGLAVCESIALQHGATINVTTSPQGSAFIVRFALPR